MSAFRRTLGACGSLLGRKQAFLPFTRDGILALALTEC